MRDAQTTYPRKGLLTLVLLVVTFLMQLPGILLGMEVCDSGFYLTFYENLFSHPESVEYNFMYYTSGLLGALMLKLAGGSMVWMRVFGALCNVLCVWMVWAAIRKPGRFLPMFIAILLITGGNWLFPLTFYYDSCSVLLATASLTLMIKALGENEIAKPHARWLLLISGLIAGINVLSRIPNILGILFVIPVIIFSYIADNQNKRDTSHLTRNNSLCFAGGWVAGLLLIVGVAAALGHVPYIVEAVSDIFDAGASSANDSNHSLGAMIRLNIMLWGNILCLAFILFSLINLFFARSMERNLAMALLLIFGGCYAILWILGRHAHIDFLLLLFTLTVTGLLFAAYSKDLRAAALCSLLMILLLPAGSDNCFYNGGPIVLWLALPVALSALCNISFDSRHIVKGLTIACASGLFLISLLSLLRGEVYFDKLGKEELCRTSVPETTGIYTSRDKEERMDAMINAVKENVPRGSVMMVYGSAPLLNYLTGTLPAMGCSWPVQMSPGLLAKKLEKSPMPDYVMLFKFNTLSDVWGDSSEEYMQGVNRQADGSDRQDSPYHNRIKSGLILDYINNRGYKPLLETNDFILYKR